jgi:ubiquinone/menaquinone biosynthesis C-methylase UbiE
VKDKEFNGGERLYLGETEIAAPDLREHFSRYEFAFTQLKDGWRVLDAACGTGYGTAILAEKNISLVGMEISDHALAWANEKSKKPNIQFIKGNLNDKLPFEDASFDAITSFETLEHIENQEGMMAEFKRVLRPGGLLLLSSPDREIITDHAHAENHFHIKELSKLEFIELLKNYFLLEAIYGQTKYVPPSFLKRLIKIIAKLDVFKLRRIVVRALGLKLFVHKALSVQEETSLVSVRPEDKNEYFVLVAVCRKNV